MKKALLILSIWFVYASALAIEKDCPGNFGEEYVHIYNVGDFKGCTKIIGSVRVLGVSFDGDPYYNRPGIHPDALSAFSDVREITGALVIQGSHPHFRHLPYFRKLRRVRGKDIDITEYPTLNVMATSLRTIDFSGLRRVDRGNVIIYMNPNLCYVTEESFSRVVLDSTQRLIVRGNSYQRTCEKDGFVCNGNCGTDICWGPSVEDCVYPGIRERNLLNSIINKPHNYGQVF